MVATNEEAEVKCSKCKHGNKKLTDGLVKMINCLSSVETKRLVLSMFRAIAVIFCPLPSFITWNTYTRRRVTCLLVKVLFQQHQEPSMVLNNIVIRS